MQLGKEIKRDIFLWVLSIGLGILIHKVWVLTIVFPISLFIGGMILGYLCPIKVWRWAVGLTVGFFLTVFFEFGDVGKDSGGPWCEYLGIMSFNTVIFSIPLLGTYLSAFIKNKETRLKQVKEFSLILIIMGFLILALLIGFSRAYDYYSSRDPTLRNMTEGGGAMIFEAMAGTFFFVLFSILGLLGLLFYRIGMRKEKLTQSSIQPSQS